MEKTQETSSQFGGSENEVESTLKIVDLPIEILLNILDQLNFESLVNVSGVDEYFLQLTRRVFRNKFNSGLTWIKYNYGPEVNELMLESFGDLVSSLRYSDYRQLIITYCENKASKGEIPFPNVSVAVFHEQRLNKSATKFNEWFPNLKTLHLIESQISDPECIEVHMPALTDLKIINAWHPFKDLMEYEYFTIENVIRSVKLNPQLRCLTLTEDNTLRLDVNTLRCINNALPNLEVLNCCFEEVQQSETNEKICFENVQSATISIANAGELENLPISFKNIWKLTILAREQLTECLDFAAKFPSLTILKIRSEDGEDGPVNISPLDLEGFANRLPQLKDFSVDLHVDSRLSSPLDNHVSRFLQMSASLAKLHIRFIPNQYDHWYNFYLWGSIMNDLKNGGIKPKWVWNETPPAYRSTTLSVDISFERKG